MPLDPLALVRAAKERHFAYQPQTQFADLTGGADYTPTTQVGRNPVDSPGGDALQRLRGGNPSNTVALANRFKPPSPLNPVEPNANGLPLPHFGDGGKVFSKVAKTLADDMVANVPKETPKQTPAVLAQKLRAGFVDPKELQHLTFVDPSATTLINGYQTAVDNGLVTSDLRDALSNKLASMGDTMPQQIQRYTPTAPAQQAGPVDPSRQLNSAAINQMLTQGHAEGGSVDDNSSLHWIAGMARKLGIPSMAEDRARVATGVAKQLYGLDRDGNLVLGGRAWTKGQGGTPAGLLDQFAAIPHSIVPVLNAISGGEESGPELQAPSWSNDAAARLDLLDQKVKGATGVGDATTLPEHIEDAVGMLATPMPASKVAKEAPMLQRALEYLTPVRPPTVGRFATDSIGMGGLGSGIDELSKRLASHQQPSSDVDPSFEDAAVSQTNAGYAGGGSTRRDILKQLAGLAAAVSAGPVIKSVVKDAPAAVKSEAPVATQVVGNMAQGITHDQGEIHGLLGQAKNELFGASDEPNWQAVNSLLGRIPGSRRAVDEVNAYKDWSANSAMTNTPEWEAENAARVARLEGHIDNLSFQHDVPIVPNPNDEVP
jgi:hypothetical protein